MKYTNEDEWSISEADFHKVFGWAAADKSRIQKTSRLLSVEDVRRYAFSAFAATYAQALARAGIGPVAAAFPGTYSNLDSSEGRPGDQVLMHVPMAKRPDDIDKQNGKWENLRGLLKFYRDVGRLKFQADPFDAEFGRGYGIHPVVV